MDVCICRCEVDRDDCWFRLDKGLLISRHGLDLRDEVAEAVVQIDAEGREALDERIGEAARNWRVERLAVIDRLVLRLALQEMLAHRDSPPRVVISEAIELARARGSNPWEVVTAISRRVPRVYVAAGAPTVVRTLTGG